MSLSDRQKLKALRMGVTISALTAASTATADSNAMKTPDAKEIRQETVAAAARGNNDAATLQLSAEDFLAARVAQKDELIRENGVEPEKSAADMVAAIAPASIRQKIRIVPGPFLYLALWTMSTLLILYLPLKKKSIAQLIIFKLFAIL